MATIVFDTHKFVRKLEAVGYTTEQAEAFVEALQSASGEARDQLATKSDLAEFKSALVKWMVGLTFTSIGFTVGILMAFIKFVMTPG